MSRANGGSTPCAVEGRNTLSRSVTKKFLSAISWCGTCGPKNWNHTGYATTGMKSASAQPKHAARTAIARAAGAGHQGKAGDPDDHHHHLRREQLLGDEELRGHQRTEEQAGAAWGGGLAHQDAVEQQQHQRRHHRDDHVGVTGYDWSKRNGEKPYAAPASTAAKRRRRNRDAARYAHHALSATPSVTAMSNEPPVRAKCHRREQQCGQRDPRVPHQVDAAGLDEVGGEQRVLVGGQRVGEPAQEPGVLRVVRGGGADHDAGGMEVGGKEDQQRQRQESQQHDGVRPPSCARSVRVAIRRDPHPARRPLSRRIQTWRSTRAHMRKGRHGSA